MKSSACFSELHEILLRMLEKVYSWRDFESAHKVLLVVVLRQDYL